MYKNGKIYKLVSRDPKIVDIYIGSTCTNLCKRIAFHRETALEAQNRKLYKFINGNWENWRIILIELYPCNSKQELLQREQYYIDLLKPTLNDNNAWGINKEREKAYEQRAERKDKRNEISKIHYQKNKDKVKQYYKIYNINKKLIRIDKEIKEILESCNVIIKNFYM